MGLDERSIEMCRRMAVMRVAEEPVISVPSPGRATANVPIPPLSFAFSEASQAENATGEDIIATVLTNAEKWTRAWSTTGITQPLSYEEVEHQFFRWVRAMEATLTVLWVQK